MKTKPYSRSRASAGEDQDSDASLLKVTGGSGVRYVGRRQGFAPYQKYKPSGVEWPSRVPGHWTVKRLKYVARRTIENGINEAGIHDDPVWPRYVRITDIKTPRSLRHDTFRSLPPEQAAQAFVDPYDILLARVGTPGISYLHVPDDSTTRICFAGYLVRYSPDTKHVAPGYVAYWTESHVYWACVRSRVIQTTIQNFSATRYKNLPMPLPPLMEQKTIVLYLDQETAKIDALIAKTQILIERLQEKRRALITETIGRGLPPDENRKAGFDPCPKLKPSGVEWLGDVPEHWETQRADRVVRSLDLEKISPSTFRNLPVLHYSIPSVQEHGAGKVEDGNMISSNKQHITSRVLLISRLNPRKSTICYAEPDGTLPTVASVEFITLFPVLVHSTYLYYVVLSELNRQRLDSHVRSVTRSHQRAPPRSIRQFWHAWPPRVEQQAIATFLDHKTNQIDTLISKSHALIDRLREKRQALITAAVTGQIDVRNAPEDEAT